MNKKNTYDKKEKAINEFKKRLNIEQVFWNGRIGFVTKEAEKIWEEWMKEVNKNK